MKMDLKKRCLYKDFYDFIKWGVHNWTSGGFFLSPIDFYQSKRLDTRSGVFMLLILVELSIISGIFTIHPDNKYALLFFLAPAMTSIIYTVTNWKSYPIAAIVVGGFNLFLWIQPLLIIVADLILPQ